MAVIGNSIINILFHVESSTFNLSQDIWIFIISLLLQYVIVGLIFTYFRTLLWAKYEYSQLSSKEKKHGIVKALLK
jgi:hypothetical protein